MHPAPKSRRLALALAALALLAGAPPARAANLFGLVTTGELYRSTDGGTTWSALATLPVRDAVALAARFSSSELFLASRTGGVHRSLDGGANWAAAGALAASDVEDLAIRPDGTLLALTASGSVHASSDQGATFAPLGALAVSNAVSLAVTTPAVALYALTRTGEVYASADGGATWAARGAIAVSDARRMRAVLGTLFVITDAGDVYSSGDAGANWSAIGTLSQVGTRGLVRNAGALAAATKEGHVATSATGASWTWRGSIDQLELTALASDEPATTAVEDVAGGAAALAPPYPNLSSGEGAFAIRLDRDGGDARAVRPSRAPRRAARARAARRRNARARVAARRDARGALLREARNARGLGRAALDDPAVSAAAPARSPAPRAVHSPFGIAAVRISGPCGVMRTLSSMRIPPKPLSASARSQFTASLNVSRRSRFSSSAGTK